MKKTIGIKIVAIVVMVALVCTGCLFKKNKIDENTNTKQAINKGMSRGDIEDGKIKEDAVLMSVGDIDVTYSEVMAYIMLYKSDYEGLLSNDIWAYEVEKGKTFERAAKECVVNQIVKSKVIEYGAEKIGVVIEPDEKIEIEDKAIECYDKVFKKLKGKYGITQAVVKDIMYDNYLASKVYEVATNEVDVVVKDSESRVPIVKQIEVLYKGYDNDGNEITRSKSQAHELIVEAGNKLQESDCTFTEIALEYSDSDKIELKVKTDNTDTAIKKAASELNKDELSNIIETGKGYYLLYCVSENDEDLQKDNIEAIIQKRQDEIFAKKYESWLSSNSIYVVSELWNMIAFKHV